MTRARMRALALLFVAAGLLSGCSLLRPAGPPVAYIAATPQCGHAPLNVSLDATASQDPGGTIVSYTWSIDGEELLHGPTASYLFRTAGSHRVDLTVVNDHGTTGTASQLIEVENTAPTASARLSSDTPTPGERVLFDASGSFDPDGDIADVAWDFGDGETARGPLVGHVYDTAGTYVVVLTVEDSCGAVATLTHTLLVSTPSPRGGGCGGSGPICL
jgi:PKD repeat protein